MSHAKRPKKSFFRRPSVNQCKDAGMALILILLLVMLLTKSLRPVPWAIALTLLLMIRPQLFRPWTALWFGFSEFMGTFMSKIILSLAFFLVVTPIALLRRLGSADALRLRQWKAGSDSVYRVCDTRLTAKDLEQMF